MSKRGKRWVLGSTLLTPTESMEIQVRTTNLVSCSGNRGLLACRNRGTLQRRYRLWSTASLSVLQPENHPSRGLPLSEIRDLRQTCGTEQFEESKGTIRSRKLEDIQCNGQKKKGRKGLTMLNKKLKIEHSDPF